jgi:hypothetical protein
VGPKCSVCDYDRGYVDVIQADGTFECKLSNCSEFGWGVIHYENVPGKENQSIPCECPPPYTYNLKDSNCRACLNPNFTLPFCGVDAFVNKAGLAPCKPYSLLLPVLLAVGISLLIIMIIVILYFVCSAKNTKKNNHVEMDDPMDSSRGPKAQYNRL